MLILPYRAAPLPTAKQIATVQELSEGRPLPGIGVGWMDAEFRALGVARGQRGRLTDEILEFPASSFQHDVVSLNGQPFIFSPRPAALPVYVGGAAPHALERALRFGHGWLPMAPDPDKLAAGLETYRQLAARRERSMGPVTALAGLPLGDPARAAAELARYAGLGIERLVCALRYDTADDYQRRLDQLAAARRAAAI